MSRRLRLLVAAIGLAALAWLLLAAFDRALVLAQRFMALPDGMRWLTGVILLTFAIAAGAIAVWWLGPRKPRTPVVAPDRASLEARI